MTIQCKPLYKLFPPDKADEAEFMIVRYKALSFRFAGRSVFG